MLIPGTFKAKGYALQLLVGSTNLIDLQRCIQHTAFGQTGIKIHGLNLQQILPAQSAASHDKLGGGIIHGASKLQAGFQFTSQTFGKHRRFRQQDGQVTCQLAAVTTLPFNTVLTHDKHKIIHLPFATVTDQLAPGASIVPLPSSLQIPARRHSGQCIVLKPAFTGYVAVQPGLQHRHPIARIELIQNNGSLPSQLGRKIELGFTRQGTRSGRHVELGDTDSLSIAIKAGLQLGIPKGTGNLRVKIRLVAVFLVTCPTFQTVERNRRLAQPRHQGVPGEAVQGQPHISGQTISPGGLALHLQGSGWLTTPSFRAGHGQYQICHLLCGDQSLDRSLDITLGTR